jgi:hypothetical protein
MCFIDSDVFLMFVRFSNKTPCNIECFLGHSMSKVTRTMEEGEPLYYKVRLKDAIAHPCHVNASGVDACTNNYDVSKMVIGSTMQWCSISCVDMISPSHVFHSTMLIRDVFLCSFDSPMKFIPVSNASWGTPCLTSNEHIPISPCLPPRAPRHISMSCQCRCIWCRYACRNYKLRCPTRLFENMIGISQYHRALSSVFLLQSN